MNCPVCGRSEDPSSLPIAFCSSCGHRWLKHSAEAHRQIEEDTYGHEYAGYREDIIFSEGASKFLSQVLEPRKAPPARILDVGCGAGAFMKVAMDHGYSVQGIDVSEASAQICRNRGLRATAGDFLETSFDERFDLITMWDVMEHLANPGAFLMQARNLLAENGIFFAKIPGFGSLSVRLSGYAPRLGGILLGAPAHVQFFSDTSLRRLFEDCGFTYELIHWGSIRQPPRGGSPRRQLARKVAGSIAQISGDKQFYVVARPV